MFAEQENNDLVNYAIYLASELRASSPYKTGNMQRSIVVVAIEGFDYVDIVIATDYASYVNKGKPRGSKNERVHKGWIERVVDRAARSASGPYVENAIDNPNIGVIYE